MRRRRGGVGGWRKKENGERPGKRRMQEMRSEEGKRKRKPKSREGRK